MKKYVFAFIILASMGLSAQTIKITGTVTDYTGLPLPGVNIIIKGTSNGTQTDFDGNYALSAAKNDILEFSYLGYDTVTHTITDTYSIDITMEEDVNELQEVVILGYGIQKRRNVTSAVSRVSSESLETRYRNNFSQKLQGKVSGLVAKEASETLYIVDEIPIPQANNTIVQNIHPHEIEKKHIYNVSKAKRTYGISGKKGCVVITTRDGDFKVENDESYAKINENKFEQASLSPLSTFSIDVDKASYSNIRRMINRGQDIVPGAVKIEEMINYFDYKYPQPTGAHPFAIHTDVAETPWNGATKLVRIGLQGKEYTSAKLPASNLTFLIDVSGSMSDENKLPLLKKAFTLLVNQLREKDKVSIVVYAGAAGVVLEPTSGADKETIISALDNLDAGGSTAGGEGIELAYSLAQKNFKRNGNNRVILATDGDFNVGASTDEDMEALIEEKRKSGVFLSVLGFGMDNYKDSKLETLADKGNGNHAYIDTMQEAQKVFGKEFGGTLHTIAKDVKIQVEFNPALVQSYRLIGYENRMLAAEDFTDDTKDAGELGAGHKVTALYEIVPVGVENAYTQDKIELKYTDVKKSNTYSNELLTVKLRYKKPNRDTSIEIVKEVANAVTKFSNDLNFSSAVALFGMHLRNSSYLNETTMDQVVDLAEKGRGVDEFGYRSEFIRLVKAYSSSL